MQSLILLTLVFNVMAILNGPSRPQIHPGSHHRPIHVEGMQRTMLLFPTIIKATIGPVVYPSEDPTRSSPLPEPSNPSPQYPTTNPSTQPEPPKTFQSSPAFMNECVCTPFFRCFDNETSSNLTNVVNDRTIIPSCQIIEKTCSNPNDVCCCNLDPSSSSTPKALSQSQAPSPSEISKPNANCNCRPINDCHDDVQMDKTLEKGNCKEPNHVCCHEHVLKVNPTTPSLETSPVSQNPQHQSPIPSEVSASANAGGCTCTPFFKCFDQETSSNLTGLVNDRTNINQCPNSNDICCHNRSSPSGVIEAEAECTRRGGLCQLIEYCPELLEAVKEAHKGNSEATLKLRKSVCSNRNDLLHVCCPQ